MGQGNANVGSFVKNATAQLGKVTSVLGGGLPTAAAAGGVAIAAGLAIGTKALYDLGAQYDNSTDKLVSMTGAHGAELSKLEGVVKTTYGNVTASLMDTTTVVGILGQKFHDLNAADMSKVSATIIELNQLIGGDLTETTTAATKIFADWNVKGSEMAGVLDKVKVAADASGMPVASLMNNAQMFGTSFRNLGFSMEETLAIMARAEATGVTVDVVLTTLRKGVSSLISPSTAAQKAVRDLFGEKGLESWMKTKDPAKRFKQLADWITLLEAKGQHPEALNLASLVFGKKGGQDIVDMIAKGTFNTGDLIKKMEQANGTIHRQKGATEDAADRWIKLGHKAQNALQPLASAVFDAANALSEKLLPVAERFMNFLIDHQDTIMFFAKVIGIVLVAAIGVAAIAMAGLMLPSVAIVLALGWLYENWQMIWSAVASFFVDTVWHGILEPAFNAVVTFFTETIPGAFWKVYDGAVGAFQAVIDWVTGFGGAILGAIGDTLGWLWQKGNDLLQGLWNGILFIWDGLYLWYVGIPMAILGAIGDVLGTLWQKGADLIQGLWNGAISLLGNINAFFTDRVFTPIVLFFVDAVSWLFDAGKQIIKGLIDGILSFAGKVKDAVGDVISGGIDKGKEILGLGSPSKVFHAIGVDTMEGLRLGIEAGSGGVQDAMAGVASDVAATQITAPAAPVAAGPFTGAATAPTDAMATALATTQDLQGQTTDVVQGATDQQLAIQQLYGGNVVANAGATQEQLNAVWLSGMNNTLATTDSYWSLLNASTANQFAVLSLQVQGTMTGVVSTMTAGASSAADSFVGALNARIPPLQATLSAYGESVKAYGRDYLTAIGAPVNFAVGGVMQGHENHFATIARGPTMRIWNEPETGGEAYIPLGSQNRGRSVAITSAVAKQFGYSLQPFAEGGFSLPELFWEAMSGTDWKNGVDIGRTIGGHADHTHAAISDGHQWPELDAYLTSVGISPGAGSTTGGTHASGSYHYRAQAKDYGTASNGGMAGVDRIYQAFLAIVGGGGMGFSLPMPDVPPPPDFGPGIPAYEALVMAFGMRASMQTVLEAARQKVIDSMAAGGGASIPAAGPYKEYARALMASHGWDVGSQFPPLDMLWNKESHWDPSASNGTYYGIPQGPIGILSRMTPYEQIAWGEDYISQRYGTPSGAWAHSQAVNWYGLGGILGNNVKLADWGARLDPGWNNVFNGTGGVETLRPTDSGHTEIHVYPSEGMDERKLARKVRQELDARDAERAFLAGSVR